jgi:hypothetical protein
MRINSILEIHNKTTEALIERLCHLMGMNVMANLICHPAVKGSE